MSDFRKFFRSKFPYRVSQLDDRIDKINNKPLDYSISPFIVKEAQDHMIEQNIFSYLLENRIIFFGEEFNSDSCNIAVGQILYLNQLDDKSDINIYINSPGGNVTDCFGLLSVMDAVSNDFSTVALGLAASCGNLLLVSGTVGKRKALRLSKLLVHQPMGGASGQCSDVMIEAKFLQEIKDDIADIYVKQTGLDRDKVIEYMDRDNWVKPQQALSSAKGGIWGNIGMIDEIVVKI